MLPQVWVSRFRLCRLWVFAGDEVVVWVFGVAFCSGHEASLIFEILVALMALVFLGIGPLV